MATLKEKMQTRKVEAMKIGDKFTVSTISLVLGYVQNAEKSGKSPREFNDSEMEAFVAKQVRTCRESAALMSEHGKHESAAMENAQAELLSEFLPRPLGEGEVMDMIEAEVAAQSEPNVGSLMKALKPRVGNRFDGKRLSELVRVALS